MQSAVMKRPAGLRPFVQHPAGGLCAARRPLPRRALVCAATRASLQFIKGVDETCVPDVQLTRSRSGVSGSATFVFDSPDVFNASAGLGDVTGLYLIDEEGVLQTVEVQAKFVNGKPKVVEAKYNMRSTFEWDRFMRFMSRYAEANGLGFSKA